MKIAKLEIKNCLGIEELSISPGKVNVISGGNEKGKTSILESLEKGLYNTDRRAKFVKNGESAGTLYIELDNEMNISRRVKEDGTSTVKILHNESVVSKPETFLKSLVGEFAFNPVDFMNKKDKEQTQILLSLMPMRLSKEQLTEWFGEVPPVDLSLHALEILTVLSEKYYYDQRTLANGEVKECQNEIDSIKRQLPENYNGDTWRNIVISELWDKVREGEKVNHYREQALEKVNGLTEKIESIESKYKNQKHEQKELLEFKIEKAKKSVEEQKTVISIEIRTIEDDIKILLERIEILKRNKLIKEQELKAIDENIVSAKIEGLEKEYCATIKAIEDRQQEEISVANTSAENAKKYLKENAKVDIEPLKEKANDVEKMKGFISLYDNYMKLEENLWIKQVKAEKLDSFVKLARNKPMELLANIELPVKGLGINDEMQITIDGLPIRNLSTSRQIKLALDIARATSSKLKLICVDRWEALDNDQRAIFLSEIETDDFQYFITHVTSGDLKIERMV